MEAYSIYIYPRCTHLLSHSLICPHNALVSNFKLVTVFQACNDIANNIKNQEKHFLAL